MLNLDSAAFRAWLEAQPPQKWAGIPVDGCRCPVANYLMTLPGVEGVDVGNISVTIYRANNAENMLLPDWTANFIHEVDSLEEPRITAAAALEILARVERLEAGVQ